MSIDSEPAYRVPFAVSLGANRLSIANHSADDLPWVRVELFGGLLSRAVSPGHLASGEAVQLRWYGDDPGLRARLQVTWMRAADDGPYIWRRAL